MMSNCHMYTVVFPFPEKVLERGEKLDILIDKTENLEASVSSLLCSSKRSAEYFPVLFFHFCLMLCHVQFADKSFRANGHLAAHLAEILLAIKSF